jgi:centromere protein C
MKPRGRPKKDKSKNNAVTPTSVLRTKKSKTKKNESKSVNWSTPNGTAGYPIANREYEYIPVSELKARYAPGQEPRTPGGSALRRSKRFRVSPLQFWKNEKFIYAAQNEEGLLGEAMGDMPVVKDVQRALPTPHKERPKKEPKKKEEPKKKKRRHNDDDSDDDDRKRESAKVPFDPSHLMKKYKYSNGERGVVWSEALEDTAELKLVSRLDNRSFSKLPLSTSRGKKESKVVGFASQAFHVPTDQDDLFPGYISGNVVLPPRGIKDAEGVGLCSQVFNVGDCQPNSVEFALADPASQDGEFDPATAQRFLLSKGDMFQIPPGNVYRIENHSRTDEARLFWTIIKCTSRAEQESDEE